MYKALKAVEKRCITEVSMCECSCTKPKPYVLRTAAQMSVRYVVEWVDGTVATGDDDSDEQSMSALEE
jgi:malate synthase